MSTKEVITLQLGHYANFVGTHWWNLLHEELVAKRKSAFNGREDVSFETEPEIFFHNSQSDNATPRLISLDVKECLRSLSESGEFRVGTGEKKGKLDSSSTTSWQGETQVANRAPQTRFLDEKMGKNLDSEVKVWSDFLVSRLHTKTMVLVPASSSQNETDLSQNDESWTVTARQICEEMEDRIRYFSEACDSLDGFHLITTVHDGCSSLCVDMLHYLSDDFSRKCALLVPVAPAQLSMNSNSENAPVQRLVNWARFLPEFWSESSLVTPLTLSADSLWQGPTGDEKYPTVRIPNLNYNSELSYHTSAILAAALDTVTLPYRLDAVGSAAYSPHIGMAEFFGIGSKYLKLNQMEIVLPYSVRQPPPPSPQPATPVSVTWTPLIAPTKSNRRLLSRCATLRGVEVLVDPKSNQSLDIKRYRYSEASRDFDATLDVSLPVVDSFVKTNSCTVARQLATIAPFPKSIFAGEPARTLTRLPMASALVSSGLQTGSFLDTLHNKCQHLSRSKYSTNLPEMTEWSEHLEWLIEKAQYAHGLK